MSEMTLSGDRPESSLQVWGQLLDSLQRSGFREAGPEYLKLSQLVATTRKIGIFKPSTPSDDAAWERLREVGVQAHSLLAPLAEAARILAELPIRATIVSNPSIPTSTVVHPPQSVVVAPRERARKLPAASSGKSAPAKSGKGAKRPVSKKAGVKHSAKEK